MKADERFYDQFDQMYRVHRQKHAKDYMDHDIFPGIMAFLIAGPIVVVALGVYFLGAGIWKLFCYFTKPVGSTDSPEKRTS